MTPRLLLAGIACTTLIAGCGGFDESTSVPIIDGGPETVAQKHAADEASNELMRLDREAALVGVDANGDGVRDDVAAFIAALPNTALQKKALEQVARAVTGTLVVDVDHEEKLRLAGRALAEAVACTSHQYGDGATDKVMRIESLMVNTPERLDAYERYNKARSGSVSTLPNPEESCQ